MNYDIQYGRFPVVIEGYNNATWNLDQDESTSMTAWIYTMAKGAISLKPQKQTCVSHFTIEPKFMALSLA